MPGKTSIHTRRLVRAAFRRFEAAQFLFDKGSFTTDAVYLAGYAIECMLKALILSNEPARRNSQTLATFRGSHAHVFDWLKEQLADRRVHLPTPIVEVLARTSGWATSLRYEPALLPREDAEVFLKSVDVFLQWAMARL